VTAQDDVELRQQLELSLKNTMELKIGKVDTFIPKADLRYDEFLHIKSTFNKMDFENSSRPFAMGIFAHFGIVLIGKMLRRTKML